MACRYRGAFGPERAYVELQHHKLLGTPTLLCQLIEGAGWAGLLCVATNSVPHAPPEDWPVHDRMTCTRLGIPVDQPHAERPRNDEAPLKSGRKMATLFTHIPQGRAVLRASSEIAARCHLSLLKGTCTAPQVPLPEGVQPASHLRTLCEAGLRSRYAAQPEALQPGSPQRTQLDHELAVITQLELVVFFLYVHGIMPAPRQLAIRIYRRARP